VRSEVVKNEAFPGVIGVLWAQYGPYHFARTAALQKLAGPGKVRALELANLSSDYQWQRSAKIDELVTICPGAEVEHLPFWRAFRHTRRVLTESRVGICLLPGYAPKQSFAALLAAKSLRIRTVMMNESHAGTARARGIAVWVKRRLVGWFDAALVGGLPQKRYVASLGLPPEKIFIGYDAVDNEYFASRAEQIRCRPREFRSRYHLPDHYFLSLGRFVAKKNLSTLIRAYRQFLDASSPNQIHLVLVGSGEEEPVLRSLCAELKLPVYYRSRSSTSDSQSMTDNSPPGVHFYGFRQIEENPAFYALADAFILPSLYEEWGLVVNEAMASGLPVVVSETAGCAEDLLRPVSPGALSRPDFQAARANNLEQRLRENGFTFAPASSGELCRIFLSLASSMEMRKSMGKASRRIVENYSCETFARNALRAIEAATNKTVSDPGSAS